MQIGGVGEILLYWFGRATPSVGLWRNSWQRFCCARPPTWIIRETGEWLKPEKKELFLWPKHGIADALASATHMGALQSVVLVGESGGQSPLSTSLGIDAAGRNRC